MTREEARDQIVIFMNDEHEVINDRDREALEIAIKALEQEQYYKDTAESYEKTLNKLTKAIAEQEPKWISCSERLPEKDGEYLTYIINPYDERFQYSMTCYYSAKVNSWFPDDESASNNVIAWMSLPEPYKEG